MKSRAFWFAGILVAAAFAGGFYLSGCGSSKPSVTCCDNGPSGICTCFENQTCDSGEKMVNACPNYGNCCRYAQMSDYCMCWDVSCDETAGTSSKVGSCP
jgi:hypothetical protein